VLVVLVVTCALAEARGSI